MNSLMPMPKKIHQIWWQGEEKIPKKFKKWQLSWKKFHPNWEYNLWSNENMYEFVYLHEPEIFGYYSKWPLDASRGDAFRYIVLKHLGGVYVDMDIECLKPIDYWVDNSSLLLSKTYTFNNAIFGGCSEHPLFIELCKGLKVKMDKGVKEFFEKSGPLYFAGTISRLNITQSENCKVAPHWAFEPLTPYISDSGQIVVGNNTGNSYAIHHETLQWQSWTDRLISRISQKLVMPIFRLWINLIKKSH